MPKLKIQYFGHLMQRANSLEKTLKQTVARLTKKLEETEKNLVELPDNVVELPDV